MNASEQVSVVISAYNAAPFVERAIASVLTQDVDAWELLVLDDGSTDDTYERITDLRDPRIRSFHWDTNEGKSRRLNDALRLCHGKYLLELDADDWLAPCAVRVLGDELRRSTAFVGLVTSDYRLWTQKRRGGIRDRGVKKSDQVILNRAMGQPPIPRAYKISALDDIGGWPIDEQSDGRLFEDVAVCSLLFAKYAWTRTPSVTYHRLLRRDSVSQAYNTAYGDWAQEWFQDVQEYSLKVEAPRRSASTRP